MPTTNNNLIRLSPLPFSSLPSHPSLQTPSSGIPSPSRPSLHHFLTSTLSEASSLLSSIPTTFHPDPKPRSSPPAEARVHLSTSTRQPTRRSPAATESDQRQPSSNRDEFWVCRRSIHANAARPGTASWDEFRAGLSGDNHSENEAEYTPTVSAVERLVSWDVSGELGSRFGEDVEGGWLGVEMHVNLITHTFRPSLLISPRTFISLVVSAHRPDTPAHGHGDNPPRGFITVQIPLTQHPPDSIPSALRDKIIRSVPGNTIFAAYASVEQVASLANGDIDWTMATTSNAGGFVPQWVQRSWTMGGVPKAVVADVGLFIGWIARTRSK